MERNWILEATNLTILFLHHREIVSKCEFTEAVVTIRDRSNKIRWSGLNREEIGLLVAERNVLDGKKRVRNRITPEENVC